MKFLILNADYLEFLGFLYVDNPGLEQQTYEEQMRVRNDSLFGVANFWSSNLIKLGYEAWDIHVNNEWMQRAWARENGISIQELTKPNRWVRNLLRQARLAGSATPLRNIKFVFAPVLEWLDNYHILAAQVKQYQPDVLINQVMGDISCRLLGQLKPYTRMIVGNHTATQLPRLSDWSCYDLIISSYPPTVDWFKCKGIQAEFSRLGFEPRVLSCLDNRGKKIEVSFVGNLFTVHDTRVRLLEQLCRSFDVKIWAPRIEHLDGDSPIREHYMGPCWGRNMYQIIHESKITINHHGNIGPYANNMRLFEATGVGTLLITDWKENLPEMFEPEKEVVTYRSPEHCVDAIGYYLQHEEDRQGIARAGQERTLREHTYAERMAELVDIVNKYL